MFLHRIKADFRILVFVRPARRAVCGLLQPADFLSVLLILRLCERIRALLVFPPAREIPRLHLDGLPVQYQHMVRAGIEKIPVMRNQNEPFLSGKIRFDDLPGTAIEMIGRLVNQQEFILPREQDRQHQLRALAKTECPKRPVQKLRIQRKIRHLAHHLPVLRFRLPFADQFFRRALLIFLRYEIGEIIEKDACLNASLKGILPHQQLQEGSLPLTVPSDEPEFPAGVDGERHIFKNRSTRSFIGK